MSEKYSDIKRLMKRALATVFPAVRNRRLSMPIYIFCHHKVGTVLMQKVFGDIARANGWSFGSVFGEVDRIPDKDVLVFCHSIADVSKLPKDFLGVHVCRDPRDIIVSGYLYHCRTNEKWCVNKDFSLVSPILFPNVPYSLQHQSEAFKIEYIESLNSKSYQENLNELSQGEGLIFEMEHYGDWTIAAMRQWNYHDSRILEMKFEKIMEVFDQSFVDIFEFLGLCESSEHDVMALAQVHDISRKNDTELSLMDHVSSKKTSKWKSYFDEPQIKKFKEKFGGVVSELGYEDFD